MRALLSRSEPILVLIGPSGAGKSTAVRGLVAEGAVEVTPSWTTRPPREGELEGAVEHRFVSEGEFDRLERAGFFLETVRLFGLPHRYGLPAPRRPLDRAVPLLMLRAPLLPALRRRFAGAVVYQIEADREQVAARLLRRHQSPADLGTRLRDYESEVALGRTLADRVLVNDRSMASLVEALRAAIAVDFPVQTAGRTR